MAERVGFVASARLNQYGYEYMNRVKTTFPARSACSGAEPGIWPRQTNITKMVARRYLTLVILHLGSHYDAWAENFDTEPARFCAGAFSDDLPYRV
jgi:hypothetical protein